MHVPVPVAVCDSGLLDSNSVSGEDCGLVVVLGNNESGVTGFIFSCGKECSLVMRIGV